MAKKTFNVLSPVDFNGKRYEVDSQIALEDDDAGPLLKVNAIADPKAKPAADSDEK